MPFLAGFFIAALFWWLSVEFVRDKPVPNAIFSQSIVEAKLSAAERSPKERKVVFVGGSNVLFGIDSDQFTRQTNRASFNFGCAAGMGPELILDLINPFLNSGDLVVLHWEYGQYLFTRSGQVNLTYLNLLAGPQGHFMDKLPWKDRQALSLSVPFSHLRLALETSFNPYVDASVYGCSWLIDERGNIRSNKGAIPQALVKNPLGSLTQELEITNDVREIFSDFVLGCFERDIRVIASWPNLYSHPAYAGNPIVAENFRVIREFWKSLEVQVVGKAEDAMLGAEFFHDTMYHLNAKGVAIRTDRLIEELRPWLVGSKPAN
jgi:hypothetical protein